jgi:dsDNA-specific endonuclease/ATPase MutS2
MLQALRYETLILNLSDECARLESTMMRLEENMERGSSAKTKRRCSKWKEEVECEVSEKEMEAKDDLHPINRVAKPTLSIADQPKR